MGPTPLYTWRDWETQRNPCRFDRVQKKRGGVWPLAAFHSCCWWCFTPINFTEDGGVLGICNSDTMFSRKLLLLL